MSSSTGLRVVGRAHLPFLGRKSSDSPSSARSVGDTGESTPALSFDVDDLVACYAPKKTASRKKTADLDGFSMKFKVVVIVVYCRNLLLWLL